MGRQKSGQCAGSDEFIPRIMIAYKEGADTMGVVQWAKSLKKRHRGPLPVKRVPYNRNRWEGRGREGQEGGGHGRGEEDEEIERAEEPEGVEGEGGEGEGEEVEGGEGEEGEDEAMEGEGEGVEGEGVGGEEGDDEAVEGEGVEGEGVEGEGVGGEEEEDYSDVRKAAFFSKVFNYLRRSQAKPDGKWELYFHLDTFLDFLISDGAAFSEVANDTN